MSGEKEILERYHTIAVVGLTSNPDKVSNRVTRYMMEQGYRIIPVNPQETEIFGLPCYPNLKAVPEPVEFVDVFRRPEYCADVAREAAEVGAKALWLQLGITSDEARRIAEEAGIAYVEDACVLVEHRRYGIGHVGDGVGG